LVGDRISFRGLSMGLRPAPAPLSGASLLPPIGRLSSTDCGRDASEPARPYTSTSRASVDRYLTQRRQRTMHTHR
jgi:hypothetical protein